MSRFLSPRFAKLKPYEPGDQPQHKNMIKLNTNESPYEPSPKVLAALNSKAISQLQLYPDPDATELVTALAKYYGVDCSQIFVGNGSDEILAFSFMAFCDQNRGVVFPDITYSFYKVYAELFAIDYREIPLKEDFTLNISDYIGLKENIFIANPNAPTGLAITLEQLETILKANPDVLVSVDEAYVDFGGISCAQLLPKYDNLLLTGTLSKSRSLAGARIGFAVAAPEIIADFNKIKFSFNPYNVNSLSLIAGVASLEDEEYFQACTQAVAITRQQTMDKLKSLGFTMTDSITNFIFVKHPRLSGADYCVKLKEKGILVRHFEDQKVQDYVRITIGSPQQMARLFHATLEILAEGEIL